MDHLGVLDTAFWLLERRETPMHVGSLMVFEGPAPAYADMTHALETQLHLVPRYRQKVRAVPLDLATPIWVDDEHFSIDFHVRHTALPSPGDGEQLRRLFSRVMSLPLDFRRPVWEAWLVEGLEGGRWALMNKVHHCMIDGMSGADIVSLLFSRSPDTPIPPGPPWHPRPEPSTRDVLADGLGYALTHPMRRVGHVVDLARTVPNEVALRAAGALRGALPTLSAVPPNRFDLNGPIGPHRRWTWVHGSLADVKAVRAVTGATVNDVILAAISLGFRTFLHGRGEDVRDGVVTTMVPVSTRAPGAQSDIGNQVTAFFADLPVGVADPLDVVDRVAGQLRDLKQSGSAISVNMMVKAVDFVPSTLFALGARLSARAPQRSVSTVTTNVPGPQWPLYLIGRELLEMFPYIPIAYDVRITIGIFSYNGKITMGITGDADAVDDVDSLAAGIEQGLGALRDAAAAKGTAAAPSPPARPRRRASRAPAG